MSGKAELIPEKTRQSLLKLKEETKNNTGLLLNMALSYSALFLTVLTPSL